MRDRLRRIGAAALLVAGLAAVVALAVLASWPRHAKADSAAGYYPPFQVLLQSGSTTNAVVTNTATWTNGIAGATTVTDLTRWPVPAGAKDTTFEFSFAYNAASTSNAVIVLARSLGGGLAGTNVEQVVTWTIAGSGTTQITACTNLGPSNVGGSVGYWYVYSIQNTHATAALTNFTMRVSSR